MNKLTAEECRLLINGLSGNRSIREDKYLAALEIAPPILEQQERGCQKCGGTGEMDSGGTQPWGEQILVECDCKFEQQALDEDDWIEWGGGERPTDSDCFVEVKFKAVDCTLALDAWEFDWIHYGNPSDIIAYRIIPERATNQNGEQ